MSEFGKITKIMLGLIARPGETLEQAKARVRRDCERWRKMAEVEECLAWNALYGIAIPNDVTDVEIRATVSRFRKNTIFPLNHSGHISYGRSFTESARDAVIEKAKGIGAFAAERGAELSDSAALDAILCRYGGR